MAERRTPEELVELAKEIRRRVNERVREAVSRSAGRPTADTSANDTSSSDTSAAVDPADRGGPETEFTLSVTPERTTVPTSGEAEKETRDDSYWDLGKPKPRIYAKPEFRSHSVSVTASISATRSGWGSTSAASSS